MKRISFDQRFVNKFGNDLIPGKIHTIRENFDFWKRFEGRDVALFVWDGKPYQKGSKQKVFCTKRIVSVQEIFYMKHPNFFQVKKTTEYTVPDLAKNDGFRSMDDLLSWFRNGNYKFGKMAILHFTDFWY